MFNINNKDTRSTSLTLLWSFLLTLNIFQSFFYLKDRNFCDYKLLWNLFLRLRHEKKVFYGISFCDLGILWQKCGIYFRDPNVLTRLFKTSQKNDIVYMGIICTSFLSKNLLCKNIYIMSFMWSNELCSILK